MTRFSVLILAWYAENARTLPWRGHSDPYAVWVSEIMLQQTRVETVIPYFERWLKLFPTVNALAEASEQNVLSAWEGLGYYSRARNLKRAARIVVDQHGGKLPRTTEALSKLPGIGRYTAAAIASIAFGADEATLDGNLRRVLARVFDVQEPADSPRGGKILWALSADHLPVGRAGDYNQALMDLGATICLPKKPQCALCPVHSLCLASARGVQAQRPVLKPKTAVPTRIHAAAVVRKNGRVLLSKRDNKGLLGGLWEFPNIQIENRSGRGFARAIKKTYGLKVRKGTLLGEIHHAYTHFRLIEFVYFCEALELPKVTRLRWMRISDLANYPMGKVDRQIARKLSG